MRTPNSAIAIGTSGLPSCWRTRSTTDKTVAEAKQLSWLVDRDNAYIKIPATGEGVRDVLRALMAVIEDARGKSEPKTEHAAWQP